MSTAALIICGFLLGTAIQLSGFSWTDHVRQALRLADWLHLRVLLYTLGLGMMMTACLCYLAVIDVDLLEITPLTSKLLLGGVVFGVGVGVSGLLPGTALAGIGGGRFAESLCGVLGCVAGRMLVGVLPVVSLPALFPPVEGTLFRLTLTDPYLLGGSFAALACLGVLLCTAALCFRPRRQAVRNEPTDTEPLPAAADTKPAPIADDAPVMSDHPDLDPAPDADDPPLLEAIAEAQAQSGLASPAQEADLPTGARALLTNHPDDEPASDEAPNPD